jgi:hypothetical protein
MSKGVVLVAASGYFHVTDLAYGFMAAFVILFPPIRDGDGRQLRYLSAC